MRNLIFKIDASLRAAVLLTLLAVAVTAQGTGDSVVIIDTTPAGGPAGQVAHWTETKIGAGLLDKFPCVDFASTEDIAAILGHERMKELLGGEETGEEQWKNLAGAVGARYIVAVSVTVLPNGQTIVSAKVIDAKTATTIANEMETAANAEAALDNAESVAKKLMQAFSSIFKNRCEAHWTGSINYTHLIQTSKTENRPGFNYGGGHTLQYSETKSENLSLTANIMLQPMTLGFNGKYSTQARVTQDYRYLYEFTENVSGEMPCREPGRNTYFKKVTGGLKKSRTENGADTDVVAVVIMFYGAGNEKYAIKAKPIKTIKTTGRVEERGRLVGCTPTPFSTVREIEDSKGVGFIDLEGTIDPKNPDVLTGKTVEGDLETGLKTWEWKLRLVRPNQKKALK